MGLNSYYYDGLQPKMNAGMIKLHILFKWLYYYLRTKLLVESYWNMNYYRVQCGQILLIQLVGSYCAPLLIKAINLLKHCFFFCMNIDGAKYFMTSHYLETFNCHFYCFLPLCMWMMVTTINCVMSFSTQRE